jgi:thioredoxin-related protein
MNKPINMNSNSIALLMNKKILLPLLSLLLVACGAQANKDGWLTNYDEALAKARAEDRLLLVQFHGSDWCPPCIKMTKEVLATDTFKALADESLVLLDVDFPRRTPLSDEQRAHNEALAQKHGLQGVPMVLLINGEGEVLDRMVGFPSGGLKGFMSFVKAHAGKKG